LVKASWSVLQADKELLIFPILSTIAVITVMATFAVPMFLAGVFDGGPRMGGTIPFAGIALGFCFYAVQYTVVFYCNSALVGAAMIRLNGGNPTIGDGFRIANKHFASILGYALVSATVGIILRSIAERGFIGRIVASVLGLGWNLATFLAVPVLVIEGVGPIDAVKRSTQLLKKTWGEQIAGNLGLGAAFTLLFFLMLVPFGAALALAIMAKSAPFIIGVVAVYILAVMVTSLVASALSAIYTAAVYRYATEGDPGGLFDAELVRGAFRPK
jgi:hypothetical protein